LKEFRYVRERKESRRIRGVGARSDTGRQHAQKKGLWEKLEAEARRLHTFRRT